MAHSLESEFITREHYAAFGRIIQAFVSVETLYAHAIARMLQIEDGASALVFSYSGYDDLKNLMKTVLIESNLTEVEMEEGLKLLDRVGDKSVLRNNVAHTSWRKGRRPGSIKPLVVKAKGKLFLLGAHHNEKDWTAEELNAEADEILDRAFAVGLYLRGHGVKLGAESEETEN